MIGHVNVPGVSAADLALVKKATEAATEELSEVKKSVSAAEKAASDAASAAEDAASAATQAQNDAADALTSANEANEAATDAKTAAENAASAAINAGEAASDAQNEASEAKNAATAAKDDAAAAKESAETAEQTAQEAKTESAGASSRTRHYMAHEALWKYHRNDLSPQLQNLLVMDLSKPGGEALELSQLQDVHGTPRLIHAVEPSWTASVEQVVLSNHNAEGEAALYSFTPTGYGKIVSVKLPASAESSNSDHLFLRVYDDVGLLYESARFEIKARDTNGVTVTLDCPLMAGHPHQIRLCRDASYSGNTGFTLAAGTLTLTTGGAVYASGTFKSRTFALAAGSVLELWVYYTGTAPALELSVDSGAFSALSHAETGTAPARDGTSCSFRRFRIAEEGGHSVQFRFTLSSSDTVLREACGCLL